VTPPSGAPGTGFHPEPAHTGQTSAAVFMIVYFRLCTRTRLRRNSKLFPLCAHPVETCSELWRTVEKRRKLPCRGAQIKRDKHWHFRLILPLLPAQPFASGAKTGNWHVFPIDNPVAWARMAIAGARALSFPPRLIAREP
jgi:hypothetical protein